MFGTTLLHRLSNASVVIKSAILSIVLFYLIGLIPSVYNVLSLSPAFLLPPKFRVWTLITGLLMEASFFNLLIDIPVLIVCGMYLEPVWGAMELLKFIAITGIGTAILTSFFSLAAYAVTHNYALWFVQFSGIAGVIGGITVAFKQILPDQKLNLKIKVFRVQELPFLAIMIFIFLSVIHLFQYTQTVMMVCGITVGWTYLRFYQPRGRGARGDMSESFEAATLFPNVIRPIIRISSTAFFKVAVSIGLCKLPVRTYDVGGPSSITISLPGTDPADAERRRKKALRALNERLERRAPSVEDEEEENWPTIEDELNRSQTEALPASAKSETAINLTPDS